MTAIADDPAAADERAALAAVRAAASGELHAFTSSAHLSVREALAGRADLPEAVAVDLAGDPAAAVQAILAGNRDTPRAAFAILARSPLYRVQRALAANTRTPADILEQLAGGPHRHIDVLIAANWSATDETIAPLVVAAHRSGTPTARQRTAQLWPTEVIDTIRILLDTAPHMSDGEILAVAEATAAKPTR